MRWQITNVPEEVDRAVRQIAQKNRETVRTVVLQLVKQSLSSLAGVQEVSAKHQRNTNQTPKAKFVEPTDQELDEEYRKQRYHFNLAKFKAYYRTRGWKPKGSNVQMKDWRPAMVTSEEYWKDEHGVASTNGGSQGEPVREAVKCEKCGDVGMIHQDPKVAGPRLVPCPECGGKGATV